MPVGTAASVKTLTPDELRAAGAEILLANTYHLSLRPGAETVRELGGLHRFMGWNGPILTDSGGFQVMSLSALRKVDDDGVEFRSHLDGSRHRLTPEDAIQIQDALGTDIAMSLDQLVELPAPPDVVREAVDRTVRWAARGLAERERLRSVDWARWRCSASTRAASMRMSAGAASRACRRCRSTATRSADSGSARDARSGSSEWKGIARCSRRASRAI
jgi:tRNA-guanine family transglycosylase